MDLSNNIMDLSNKTLDFSNNTKDFSNNIMGFPNKTIDLFNIAMDFSNNLTNPMASIKSSPLKNSGDLFLFKIHLKPKIKTCSKRKRKPKSLQPPKFLQKIHGKNQGKLITPSNKIQ